MKWDLQMYHSGFLDGGLNGGAVVSKHNHQKGGGGQAVTTLPSPSTSLCFSSQAQERPTEGVVVAMGPGRKHEETGAPIPLPCSIGDKVLYGEFDGTAVNYMNTDYQFVRDNNILFVYSGEQMDLSTIKMIRDEILVKV
ncbi:unnamed protein product, partial [Choristocarpus tenellus]